MPALQQIGQFQDALIPANYLLQADEHYVAFVDWSWLTVVKLPTAVFIVMRHMCDPIIPAEDTPV